jgi:YHS domain-containing protein
MMAPVCGERDNFSAVGVTVNKDSMSFISRVIRFLFWLLVLSWSVALLRRLVAWMLRGGAPEAPPKAPTEGVDVAGSSGAVGMARRLVRDPVCGAHVAEVLSIPLHEGGELLHFCSTACRDQYLLANAGKDPNTKKIAASG